MTRKAPPLWVLWAGGTGLALADLIASWVTKSPTPSVAAALFLGAATVWLGWGARQSIRQAADFRVQDKRDRRERSFRAALLEQLDQCRMWLRWEPNHSDRQRAQKVLKHHLPVWHRLGDLLERETIDPACRARLLWRLHQLVEWVEEKGEAWDVVDVQHHHPLANDADWGSQWATQIDRHQEIVGLLLGAATQSGFTELVEAFRHDVWLQPIPGPIPRASTEIGEVMQGRLPPWPADPAYEPWAPAARDRRAARVLAAQEQHLAPAMRKNLGPLAGPGGTVSVPLKTPDP